MHSQCAYSTGITSHQQPVLTMRMCNMPVVRLCLTRPVCTHTLPADITKPAQLAESDSSWQQKAKEALYLQHPDTQFEYEADVRGASGQLALRWIWKEPGVVGRSLGTVLLEPAGDVAAVVRDMLLQLCTSYGLLKGAVEQLSSECERLQKDLTTTQDQLKKHVTEKQQREQQLFMKFAVLLNEKKKKLRDMRQELEAAEEEKQHMATTLQEDHEVDTEDEDRIREYDAELYNAETEDEEEDDQQQHNTTSQQPAANIVPITTAAAEADSAAAAAAAAAGGAVSLSLRAVDADAGGGGDGGGGVLLSSLHNAATQPIPDELLPTELLGARQQQQQRATPPPSGVGNAPTSSGDKATQQPACSNIAPAVESATAAGTSAVSAADPLGLSGLAAGQPTAPVVEIRARKRIRR
eukprot:jgi/Chrzof1/13141/Cz07g21130.t1